MNKKSIKTWINKIIIENKETYIAENNLKILDNLIMINIKEK